MTGPVFVIHGVGTRDKQAFEDRVDALQVATGSAYAMEPVYWGDLGADDRWVRLTIPSPAGTDIQEAADPSETRAVIAPPGISGLVSDLAAALLTGLPVVGPVVRDSVD